MVKLINFYTKTNFDQRRKWKTKNFPKDNTKKQTERGELEFFNFYFSDIMLNFELYSVHI